MDQIAKGSVAPAACNSQPHPHYMLLSARSVFRVHLSLIGFLIGLHLLFTYLHARTGHLETLWSLFWISGEANVPSFVSALALSVSAFVALALIAPSDSRQNHDCWLLVGTILAFMALDEACTIHERVRFFVPSDRFTLAWIAIYGALLVVAGLFLFRFWLRLPSETRRILAASALVFLAGAVGVEAQERSHLVEGLSDGLNLPLILSVTIEETLEMLGVAILLFGLLRHLAAVRASPLGLRVVP